MRPFVFVALLGSTVALIACGRGGDDADVEGITASITEATTTAYPADCRRLHTLRFLEQATKLSGDAAVQACEEEALYEPAPAAERVTVSEIDVEGGCATATVALTGSQLDGQVLKLGLVEDERWKLDWIVEFVALDREKLILELGRAIFGAASTPSDADAAACFLTQLEKLDDAALEALLLEPSPTEALGLSQLCGSRSEAA